MSILNLQEYKKGSRMTSFFVNITYNIEKPIFYIFYDMLS